MADRPTTPCRFCGGERKRYASGKQYCASLCRRGRMGRKGDWSALDDGPRWSEAMVRYYDQLRARRERTP